MIEEYIKLLESFKKNQLSKLIEKLYIKAFVIINSEYSSPLISEYFKEVNANGIPITKAPLSPEAIAQFTSLIIEINTQNSIPAPKINLKPDIISKIEELIKEINISDTSLFTDFDLKPDIISTIKNLIIEINSQNGILAANINLTPNNLSKVKQLVTQCNAKRIPFTNFELDPDNISQIKKLINALHYARLTFKDLENIDVRKNIRHAYDDLILLLSNTIESAYEAAYLATHLDVNLQILFKEELDFILPKIEHIRQFAKSHKEETTATLKKLPIGPLTYKAGEITAIAADQMRPLGGNVDYNFLTQFSAVLPGYIENLTQHIEKFSSQIREKEPLLNQQKIDEIHSAARHLFNDLEKLQGNDLFISLKFLSYIHIIRNIITLSMSTLEQIGDLSQTSQDLVRDKLSQLKYDILPTLFGLVDKIEVNAMVKPGTLSIPLMKQVKKLYEALLYLPKKAIDFEAKGEELLSIEDSRFIDLRLELAYKRIDDANKALYKAQKAKEALSGFFRELRKPEYAKLPLHQLTAEVKERLIRYYKIIKPYMEELDIDFNDQIVASLLGPETWNSYLTKPLRKITRKLPADHISIILTKHDALQALISKSENSQEFHVNLNKNLIASVHKQAHLVLFPYSRQTSVYAIDESIPLGIIKNELILKLEKTDFLILQGHFRQLNALIRENIRDDVLALEHLNEKTKEKLHKLYEKLHPYFPYIFIPEKPPNKPIAPEKQKALIQNFDQYLAAVLANKPIEAEDVPSFDTFTRLARQGMLFLTPIREQWTTHSKVIYDLEKNEFLSEKDSDAFRLAQAQKLKIEKTGSTIRLKNPEQLSADQALELGQWYSNKHNKFILAQGAYEKFIDLLKNQKADEDISNLLKLSDSVKKECREQYHIIQSYFVGAAPPEFKKNVLKFDKFFVTIFSNKPQQPVTTAQTANTTKPRKSYDPKENIPPANLFSELDPYFQEYFAGIRSDWHQESLKYNELAQKKFFSENEAAVLKVAPNRGKRAHHLLKDTKISEGIHEFRTALSELNKLFNQAMQNALLPQPKGVPFPEMEHPHAQLEQSKQVRTIKDLYNSLYHIEGIALELEQLKNENLHGPYSNKAEKTYAKSLKGKYVYNLLLAYKHINEIIKLSQRIATDPHCDIITRELINKAQQLYTLFQEQTAAYQISPAQVPVQGTVQYAPLFYILNAFLISPKHIRALKNTNYLTVEELNKLHKNAKKSTLIIEALINNSNSYFKLFLQTPNMLFLYQELTKKLNEFTTTAHDAVLNNLDKIRPTLFTPMLREADHWEEELGLAPGSLSEPLRNITDEFYKGLLHPLELHSKKHIALICDKEPLEQRTALVKKQILSTKKNIRKIQNYYEDIAQLHKKMQYYNEEFANFEHSPLTEPYIAEIQSLYKKVLPKLTRLTINKKIQIEPSTYAEDHLFDALCNEGLKEYDPHFTEIGTLVTTSFHYAVGLYETDVMRLRTLEEKLHYLTELSTIQDKENIQFVEDYTTEAFYKHVDAFCSRHIGLQYTDTEYEKELKKYLIAFDKEIINTSKSAEDINLNIQNLLKEKISIFETRHYEDYYQLDSVRVALAQFKNYFSYSLQNSLFENAETRSRKSELIKGLYNIAANQIPDKNLSIKARLKEIKNLVKDPNFKTTILSHQHADTFSFTYLKICFFTLLEALHLYTPTRRILLNNMKQAVDNPPKISELIKRFGLLAKPTAPDASNKKEEQSDLDLEMPELAL